MKNATKIALGVLAATGLIAAAASASGWGDGHRRGGMGGHEGGARIFEMLDADADGVVTRDEAMSVIASYRERFDADGDGALSLGEFEGLHAEIARPRMVDRFQRLDDDGDGLITAEEMNRPFERMSRRMDLDDDGDIDRDDLMKRRDRRSDRYDDHD